MCGWEIVVMLGIYVFCCLITAAKSGSKEKHPHDLPDNF